MIEADIKADLVKLLRAELPHFTIIRHEDRWTSAIPDITVDGNRRTSWWEGKYAKPTLKRDADQELMMQRLARRSYHARYIIWEERGGKQQTRIIHPREIDVWTTSGETVASFNHRWVLAMIRKVHYDQVSP